MLAMSKDALASIVVGFGNFSLDYVLRGSRAILSLVLGISWRIVWGRILYCADLSCNIAQVMERA